MEDESKSESGETGTDEIKNHDLQQMRQSEYAHQLIQRVKDIQEQGYTNHHSVLDTDMERYYDAMHEVDYHIQYEILDPFDYLKKTDPETM